MSLWLIFLGFGFLDNWIVASETYLSYPVLSGIFSGVPLLHGPFLLLYTYYLVHPEEKWASISWLHFLPFLIYCVHFGFTFLGMPDTAKLEVMDQIVNGNPPLVLFIWGQIKALSGLVYSIFTLFLLRNHNARMRANFSNLDQLNLKWLRSLAIGLTIIYSIALLNIITVWLWELNGEGIIGLVAAIFILSAGFFAMGQSTLFGPEISPKRLVPEKYLQSRLTTKDIQQQKTQILQYFDTEQPYLEADFNMQQLSDVLNIPTRELSQVINEGFQKNFFTLVNSYRIEAVKKRIQSNDFSHLTLLAIGLSCGFNSKTTFNTVFKKMTGQTPSQFKNTLK